MRLKLFIAFIFVPSFLLAQEQSNNPDTQDDSLTVQFRNSWGVDILVSTGGVGLGGFYRYEFAGDLSGFITLSVAESKDEREMEYYDYRRQSYFSPGKINRFLVIPLMFGVQQRLFRDQIMDTFRPYVSAAAGPTLIYVTPYQEEFFTALGRGHPYYTIGGYLGAGVYVGADRGTLFGISIRYYVVPLRRGIESFEASPPMKEFGGFFITLNVGSAW